MGGLVGEFFPTGWAAGLTLFGVNPSYVIFQTGATWNMNKILKVENSTNLQ